VQLYDSRTQTLRDFTPITAGEVGIYVCGPTVQSSPHIGHMRSALVYDQLCRWFRYTGHRVVLVRNVTDIDDKVLINAEAENNLARWWSLAYRYELEFTASYQALKILPPSYEPRATANIQHMQEIIQSLIDNAHAYVADDNSGDVYFDTTHWPAYGELTHQKLENMEAPSNVDSRGKHDPRDFALWKGRKIGEPLSAVWPSPWGEGRPGWHIECSAMSLRYLGSHFDIHGGGLDLRFPHHENELAQSTAAGHVFANYWVHNGLVNVNGQKMSKSLGNSVLAVDVLSLAAPIVVRYYLGSAHYRSTIDYHDGSLAEAKAALDRITGFMERAEQRLCGTRFANQGTAAVPQEFEEAMDVDLNVPQALAVLHDTVRSGNAALDAENLNDVENLRASVTAMVDVLGINAGSSEWNVTSNSPARDALSRLVEQLLTHRADARTHKDYATSDLIREQLSAAGITIEDTPTGAQHWSLDGE
jgi:cysteinyl-tRNA synthetase